MNWNKQSYRQILELAIKQGYDFVDFLSVNLAGEDRREAILRHDIDTSPAVALEMAEIDASYNIKSTFAVLLSSPLYNPFTPANIKLINEIKELGHNIALHHRVVAERTNEEIREDILREMQVMRAFFPYTQPVFVWHNIPTDCLSRLSQTEVPDLVNVYGTKFIQGMYYISDSVTRHTPEELLGVIGKYRFIHLLLHPLIWMSEKDNMVSMISHVLTEVIRECDKEFIPNGAWKQKFPDGIPQSTLERFAESLNASQNAGRREAQQGEGRKEAAMARKHISVTELCNSVGMKHRVLGDIDRHVTMPTVIHEANEKSTSFCSKKGEDALEFIRNSKAGVIICSSELELAEEDYKDKTLVLVSNPRLAFIRVMQRYFAEKMQFGIHSTAVVDRGAEIHPDVYIGPHCYIGKCKIGENTIIHGNVYIYPNVKIGRNVIIHPGTVIGVDGFGYERNEKGELERFPSIGGVVIEDNVDIHSNVNIDRGTLGDTIVGLGSKIDKFCHIGHNVVIGKHCVITAHSVIAGHAKIGDYSWLAPGAIIRDGIEIGKNVVIGMGSVVTKNVGDGQVVFGVPARERAKPW